MIPAEKKTQSYSINSRCSFNKAFFQDNPCCTPDETQRCVQDKGLGLQQHDETKNSAKAEFLIFVFDEKIRI